MTRLEYDEAGKIVLDDIYNRPVPTEYFMQLAKLDYCIPQEAKPYFAHLIKKRREATGNDHVKFVDVGCSYGVNAALLKYDLTMDRLVNWYSNSRSLERQELLDLDKTFYETPADSDLEVIGVDTAKNAISYSTESGVLDGAISANLEEISPDQSIRAAARNADLIVSTGCFGYVTETSLERLYLQTAESRPWMAHFVLRMFDFDPAADMLAQHGYVTEPVGELVPQRRFASMEEREHCLANLRARGIDVEGLESDGWYYAQLHVSRPEGVAKTFATNGISAS